MTAPRPASVDDPGEDGVDSFDEVAGLLGGFAIAPPKLLAARALQRRFDSKYLVTRQTLAAFLRGVEGDYSLVLAGGHRLARYETLYFDTPDLRTFHDHRRGRRRRFKIRVRSHVDRGLSFLEVKAKLRPGQVDKARRPQPFRRLDLDDVALAFVDAALADYPPIARQLVPTAWTNFRRLTLVGREVEERLTVDLALDLSRGAHRRRYGSAVIIELKQPRPNPQSPAARALRALRQRPRSISKYCSAISTLERNVRCNRFRESMRALRRAESGWLASGDPQ